MFSFKKIAAACTGVNNFVVALAALTGVAPYGLSMAIF